MLSCWNFLDKLKRVQDLEAMYKDSKYLELLGNLRTTTTAWSTTTGRELHTVYYASATSKFRRPGVVDDTKQSRVTWSCNPQASAGINPLF